MNTNQVDRDTFLAHVRLSGLLTPEQLAAVLKELPGSDRGRAVARALVDRGLLTRFQAEVLLTGRTAGFVLGQYRILDQLGRGGMGRVFKAVHVTMNRVVALKVLAGGLMKTERAQQLFQREVRAAARLIHPNIVTAYDADRAQNSDRHYLVMEFVDGPNLDQLVREQGPLPVAQACDLIRQAAEGLQYAHEHGMVHRDIKPANLLVQHGTGRGPDCVVKILDFGLARLHDPAACGLADTIGSIEAGDNVVMGTPDFLSPEQARNVHQADIRSDLYSLGCTFYYLLTGHVPYPGGSSMEKLIRHGTEEPVPVEHVRPEVPQPLAAIVRRMMARNPADRFQTPAQAAAALLPYARSSAGDWAVPELHAPSVDATATPPGSVEPPSDPSLVSPGDPEECALATLPFEMGTVPDATPRRSSGSSALDVRRQTLLAVVISAGVLGFGIAVGVLLVWLLAR